MRPFISHTTRHHTSSCVVAPRYTVTVTYLPLTRARGARALSTNEGGSGASHAARHSFACLVTYQTDHATLPFEDLILSTVIYTTVL